MNKVEIVRKNIFKDFTKFLKDKNCYIGYRENIMHSLPPKARDKRNIIGFMYGIQIVVLLTNKRRLTYNIAKEFINYAFCWSDTPQGHNYWSRLSNEWKYFMYEHYSQYITLLDD